MKPDFNDTEQEDAVQAFFNNEDAFLDWEFGLEVTKLVQAAYMAAEKKQTLDLTDESIQEELKSYKSLISQGEGQEVLFS